MPKARGKGAAKHARPSPLARSKRLAASSSAKDVATTDMATRTAKVLVGRLQTVYQENAIPANAAQMKKYMRNKFEFFGLKAPLRRQIDKQVFQGHASFDVDTICAILAMLWEKDQREFQSCALDLASKHCSILSGESGATCLQSTELIKTLITSKSWWDTVDLLASQVVGRLVRKHPEHLVPVMEQWIASDNLWLRRTAILHQLPFGGSTDKERLFRYCLLCCHEKEFFIQKAIGWALREYGKHNAKDVRGFVKVNEGRLARLSTREALKHLGNST